LPLDIAASRHGHSVKYFVEVYGQIGIEGTIERIKKHNGMDAQEKNKAEQNLTCSRCMFVNIPLAEICEQCGSPTTMKKALEIEKENEGELTQVRSQMKIMQKDLEDMKDSYKISNTFVEKDKRLPTLKDKEAIKSLIIEMVRKGKLKI